MNKRQIAGIFQSNCETLIMAVNCEFPSAGCRPMGWKFTREWVTKSA
jgi:hypothetical protein